MTERISVTPADTFSAQQVADTEMKTNLQECGLNHPYNIIKIHDERRQRFF